MVTCKRGSKHYAALEPVRTGHFAHICSILPTSAPCIRYLIVCTIELYVRLKFQLDVHEYICILYSSIFFSTRFGCYFHLYYGGRTEEYSLRFV
jgi:hypothetical protein